jgi:hypothetical protein
MLQSDFPVYTSLAPRLLENVEAIHEQKSIIESWCAGGFKPITVNGPNEAERIAALGLGIATEVIESDGKPRISDIARIIRTTKNVRAGIINADCKILAYPNLARVLGSALDNAAVCSTRLDINDDGLIEGGGSGFDAFFFDSNCLVGINDKHFRLGEPWWDYWFPLQMLVDGFSVGALEIPLIIHKGHRVRWAQAYCRQFRHFCELLKTWKVDEELSPLFSLRGFIHDPRESDMSVALSQFIRSLRLSQDTKILSTELQEVEAFLRTALQSFISTGGASELRRELNELKSSRSWRYTALLREVTKSMR